MGLYPVAVVIKYFATSVTFWCSLTLAQSFDDRMKEPADFFWQLQNLTAPRGNPYIGGQNFTYCCLKAVSQSLGVDSSGNLKLLNDGIVLTDGNVTLLIEAYNRGQFPCGATYSGDQSGAPVVQVNYTWLAEECPGWALSGETNLNAWLQPLSGFLLPAIIFCLSVPRRRKLHIFRTFFVADLAGVKSYVDALLGAIGALVLVTLDTIIWLSACFAFAGPMILSGLYEALLDKRMLEFLRVKVHNRRLTLDMRCRCLMIILIGNLDLALDEPMDIQVARHHPAEGTGFLSGNSHDSSDNHELHHGRPSSLGVRNHEHSPSHVSGGPPGSETAPDASHEQSETVRPDRANSMSRATPSLDRSSTGTAEIRQHFTRIQRQSTIHLRASPWRHMEELFYGIRLYDDEDERRMLSPRQRAEHVCEMGPDCRVRDHIERPLPRNAETERQVRKTKTRLRTMLHCQYSFGSMVGAPVIFFLGGFIFALWQSLEGLGDEDIAEGLAFGQWYMTIPHIAIISGLLLAGNNPNILEGVFATERDETSDDIQFMGLHFELAYPSCYKVAWQWLRGDTKKKWINNLIETYETRHVFGNRDRDSDIDHLRLVTTLSPLDWFLILSLVALLLGVPFVLAFLTAFFTPEIGLSCRSLTFTVYACLEFSQVLLWLWAYVGPRPARSDGRKDLLNFFRRNGWLDRQGFFNPASTDWLLGPRKHRTFRQVWQKTRCQPMRALWCLVWYFLSTLFGISAIVTALGGTLMQLMGVYSAGLCYVTVANWTLPYDKRPMPVISTNSKEMIYYASVYWKPCAITAIVFMTVVSFVGWWYQRRTRDMFTTLVREIDLPEFDRDDTKESRLIPLNAPSLIITSERENGYLPDASPSRTPRLGNATQPT